MLYCNFSDDEWNIFELLKMIKTATMPTVYNLAAHMIAFRPRFYDMRLTMLENAYFATQYEIPQAY